MQAGKGAQVGTAGSVAQRTKPIHLLDSLSVETLPLVAINKDQASGQGSQ